LVIPGIVLLMAIGISPAFRCHLKSSCRFPATSFSTGEMNLWVVAFAGAVGCVLGSLVAYWVGMKGGRPLIEKYGRYVLVSRHDLDLADRWFEKRGEIMCLSAACFPPYELSSRFRPAWLA